MDSKNTNNNSNNPNPQMPLYQDYNYNDNYMNNNFNPNPMLNNFNYKSSQSGAFITTSLEKLKKGDDMDIMSELINLCDQLSLCSEMVGTNMNLPRLLEEICKNLDKTYLPEIVIYSLQCINYILDINPRLSNVIRRNGVIPKLMTIINSLGDITCLDSIVMVLDKISISNAILLLENNVFITLLNVFDFMGKPQRKSIMKICQNISLNIMNYKQFDTYIKPASPILCNLIQYDENDTDPQILEKAIGIYYNIVINLKQAAEYEKMSVLEEELIKYNYFQNFCDILNKYFILRDKKITPNLVTKILQIISITCEISLLVVDKFLSINLLPILVEIINYEFNDQIFNNSSSSINVINNDINNKANSTFLTDFFSVLIALFPFDDEKSKKDVKILSKKIKIIILIFAKKY